MNITKLKYILMSTLIFMVFLIANLILLLRLTGTDSKDRNSPRPDSSRISTPTSSPAPITHSTETKEDAHNLIRDEMKRPVKEYTYKLSTGEVISIFVPEGLNPPPPEVAERLYRNKRN